MLQEKVLSLISCLCAKLVFSGAKVCTRPRAWLTMYLVQVLWLLPKLMCLSFASLCRAWDKSRVMDVCSWTLVLWMALLIMGVVVGLFLQTLVLYYTLKVAFGYY